MERSNIKEQVQIIRDLVKLHGHEKVLEAIIDASEESKIPLPKWITSRVELDLKSSVAMQKLKDIRLPIGERVVENSKYGKPSTKGRGVSLLRLRPILLSMTLVDFTEIATALIHTAWYQPSHLRTLHHLVGQKFPDFGEVKRGMLIKIVFSDNDFTFDRTGGPTIVRRRHAVKNVTTIAHRVERAKMKFLELKGELNKALQELSGPTLKDLI